MNLRFRVANFFLCDTAELHKVSLLTDFVKTH